MLLFTLLCALVLVGAQRLVAQAPPQREEPRGRIAGRVVEAANGQPLAGVQITLGDRAIGMSDLDGHFTSPMLAVGGYSVRARRLGFQPKQYDSVKVTAGQTAVVNFTLTSSAVTLQSTVVSATRVDQAASEASLLAIQQRAAAASDGVSAEQIRRTPDGNAAAAAIRVSGVSVVEDKYVVVRGLEERYSNTLLNGVEVASPEPTKKIVPLDIFPASLLESIVVSKSATPDKPGDFSGGSVEVRTKEFPDNPVRQLSISQSFNSITTGRALPLPRRHGTDIFGFDGSHRSPPPLPPLQSWTDPFVVEKYAEGIRNQWTPATSRARPGLGVGLTFGGQRASPRTPLGYVFSLTYTEADRFDRDNLLTYYASPESDPIRSARFQNYRSVVDWGSVGNLSLKLGGSHKIGWKNLYTRNAEEVYATSDGFNADRNGNVRSYQYVYTTRDLLQTQLTGDHLLGFLLSSRIEWKATYSLSSRDEPDNRQLVYLSSGGEYSLGSSNDLWFRHLDDRQYAGQLDWALPFDFPLFRNGTFKNGVLARRKTRAFDATLLSFAPKRPSEIPAGILTLPPDLLFTPENIGTYLELERPGSLAQPYDADDNIGAAYTMLDFSPFRRLRLVGGMRWEQWQLDLFDGGRARYAAGDTTHLRRSETKPLWSGNATLQLTDRMNLRAAGFASVTRPDTRELSNDLYRSTPFGCPEQGNPRLESADVLNADLRWEWYPNPGEIISVSGFYKDFTTPIVRIVSGDNNCTFSFANGRSAHNYGGEVDLRKGLTFLPGPLGKLAFGTNVTVVASRVVMDPAVGTFSPNLTLEGQSPVLVNASLSYQDPRVGLSASVLYNRFTDRVIRYGFKGSGTGLQGPNIVEQGRGTLDAKLQQSLPGGVTLSISARNLTNEHEQEFQHVSTGDAITGFSRPGTTIQFAVGYAR